MITVDIVWVIIFCLIDFFVGMMIGVHPKVYLLHQKINEKIGSRYGGR